MDSYKLPTFGDDFINPDDKLDFMKLTMQFLFGFAIVAQLRQLLQSPKRRSRYDCPWTSQ